MSDTSSEWSNRERDREYAYGADMDELTDRVERSARRINAIIASMQYAGDITATDHVARGKMIDEVTASFVQRTNELNRLMEIAAVEALVKLDALYPANMPFAPPPPS